MQVKKKKLLHGWRAQPWQDKVFDVVNYAVMFVLLLIFVLPLYFVLIASISDPAAVWNGEVVWHPVGANLNGYKAILQYTDIWTGYRNTIIYTVVGTLVNLVMTVCAAFPLSRKDFMARNFFLGMFLATMFFSGGLIPTYLVVQRLNLINSPLAMILPSAVSVVNILITRTYLQNNIPDSLRESAELDGAGTLQFLLRIVLPLSGPILAVMALYYGVARWNSYFDALIYLNSKQLYPLQMFLRDILIQNKVSVENMMGFNPSEMAVKAQLAESIKYSVIIVASVPLLAVYPFIQKYFVKGVMLGAIKG